MPAYVIIKSKELNSLTLPTDAVLRNGKTNIVWVQTVKNSYKMKMIQIGLSIADEKGNVPYPVNTWQFNFKWDKEK